MSCCCYEAAAFRVDNARFFKLLSFDRFLCALTHVHPAADRIIVVLQLVSGKQNAAILYDYRRRTVSEPVIFLNETAIKICYFLLRLIIHFEHFSSVNLCQQLRQLILKQQKTQTI